jgi:hypothetical protein
MKKIYSLFFSCNYIIARKIFKHNEAGAAVGMITGILVLLIYVLIEYFMYFNILPIGIINYKDSIVIGIAMVNIFYTVKIRNELPLIPLSKITKFLFSIFLLLLIASIILLPLLR